MMLDWVHKLQRRRDSTGKTEQKIQIYTYLQRGKLGVQLLHTL